MRSSDYYVSPHTEEQRPRLPESLCRIVNARGAEGRHFSVTNAAGAIILPDPASTSTRRAQSVDSSGQDPVPSTERLPPIASQTQHIDTIDTRPQMLDRQHFPLPTSRPYLTKQSLTQSQTYQEFLKATSRDDARRLLRELVGHPPPSMAPWGDGGVSTSASPPHHHIEVSMDHPTSSPAKAEHRTFESRAFPEGSAMEGRRGEDDLGAYVMPKMRPRATHYWKWREDKLQSVAQASEPLTSGNNAMSADTIGDYAKSNPGARYRARMKKPLRSEDFANNVPKE